MSALLRIAKMVKPGERSSFYKLHSDFFGNPLSPYREIRCVLDSTEISNLHKAGSYVQEEPEAFIEYLNFFEMIAYLRIGGQLSNRDVKALFGYYLKQLNRPHILAYLEHRDFENLVALLKELR